MWYKEWRAWEQGIVEMEATLTVHKRMSATFNHAWHPTKEDAVWTFWLTHSHRQLWHSIFNIQCQTIGSLNFILVTIFWILRPSHPGLIYGVIFLAKAQCQLSLVLSTLTAFHATCMTLTSNPGGCIKHSPLRWPLFAWAFFDPHLTSFRHLCHFLP